MGSEKKVPKMSIGVVSLIVVLAVLCLTIFSILTLSTAMNEKSLSEKSAEAVENYYAAEGLAAQTANKIGDFWRNKPTDEEWLRFASENDVDCQIEENAVYFSYHASIDEGQGLYVAIRLDEKFTVTKWQVVSTGDWAPDESLSVWDGENINS